VAGRHETVGALQPHFAERAGELGLDGAELRYDGEPPTAEQLEARVDRDLERGTTGLGPHLDDVGVLSGERDLRAFGSQGEQRLAVLASLLAEAELLKERRGTRPRAWLTRARRSIRAAAAFSPIVFERRAGAGHECEPQLASGERHRRSRWLSRRRRERGRGGVMERIGDAVRSELGRFGTTGEMTDLVAAWPQAVGETVAQNAWPARLSRDRTLHVNASSSAWAFELQQLERDLGPAAGGSGRGRSEQAAIRPRASSGGCSDRRRAPSYAAPGGDAGAGARGPRLGCEHRVGRSAQIGRKSCAGEPRESR
jgi:hypothetical protein